MKKKTPPTPDITHLDRQQLEFIQTKVMELGSVEAVRAFYGKGDSVSEFAMMCAKAMYGKSEERADPPPPRKE